MHIHVDRDFCSLHGQCVLAAPELFRFDDTGALEVFEGELDERQTADARGAAAVCPAAAIEVRG